MKKIVFYLMISLLFISFVSAAASYTVSNPNSAKDWYKGYTYEIKWDKKGDTEPKVKIRLFTKANVQDLKIVDSTDNDGSYSWKVPGTVATGEYYIRVKNTMNTEWGDSELFLIKSGVKPGVFKPKLEIKPVFKPKPGFLAPVIEGVFDIPLGALQAGTKLYLKGQRFGTKKGKILVKGNFPGGQFELTSVKWESSKKANGVVPLSVNGNPNQNVDVVIVTSYNASSKPWKMKFVGREEKVLLSKDVLVVHCGDDDNFPVCNKTSTASGAICRQEHAICGYHRNKWGAIGDDKGADTYRITLKNGWVLKSMKKVKWYRSSNDETLTGPTPAFPKGVSVWQPTISWKVTPNDKVWYQLKIVVEGPLGTSYK